MAGLLNGRQSIVQDRSRRFDRKLFIANLQRLADGEYVDITRFVTDLSISYTMDMASSIGFNIIDKDFSMASRNYFSIGRDIIYETNTIGTINGKNGSIRGVRQLFEIASVSVNQGPGGSPSFSVQCYTKAIQQMKRDKNPSAIQGNGTEYIRNAARRYGLEFYGEETTKSKNITKSSGSKQAESLWDVMTRLASDAKFVLFEVDGFLIFASEKWLLHKWGSDSSLQLRDSTDTRTGTVTKTLSVRRWVPLQFKNDAWNYNGTKNVFRLTQYPSMTVSDNDPYAGSGSCTVERTNATQLRPGMTAYAGLVPGLSNYYLIDSVTFQEMVPDPVSVSFRTPTKDPEVDEIRQIALGEVYQQTYVPGSGNALVVNTVAQAEAAKLGAKDKYGNPSVWPVLDSRILDYPTASSPFKYPTMEYANISTSYPAFVDLVNSFTSVTNIESTNDRNSNIVTGNLNLYARPIYKTSTLISRTRPQVVDSYIYTYFASSEYRAVIIPAVYAYEYYNNETEQNEVIAVVKSYTEAVNKYNELGGFAGTAKHFGVFRGETGAAARANARDYLYLLVWQQEAFVLPKRLPDYAGNSPSIPTVPNNSVTGTFLVPVAADSYWVD